MSLREERPRSAGTPCPDEERLRQAGLLACGSTPFRPPSRDIWSQWHVADGSPLTVAGAAAVLNRVPFQSPCGEPVAGRWITRQAGAIKPQNLQGKRDQWLARHSGPAYRARVTGARKGLIGKSGRETETGAAPATVIGELPANMPLGVPEKAAGNADPRSQETGL